MKRTYSLSTSTMTGTAMHRSTYLAAIWLTILLTYLCSPVQAQTVTVEYIHTDALGSPVAVTNEAGQVIERTLWEPYGAAIGKPNYDGPGYTGHVMDGATGLTYMQQRYYDPSIGRFLSVDPITANSGTGANFNRYWYANNNPYKFTDPDGRLPIFIPVFAGVMLMMHSEYANAPALGEATRTVSPAETVGAFTSAIPAGRMGSAVKMGIDAGKMSQRGANREAKRQAGIPTSQQPKSQTNGRAADGTPVGRQQSYEVAKPGGGVEIKSVQVSRDTRGNHAGMTQIEAGTVKPGGQLDSAGRPRIQNENKIRIDFERGR